MPDHRRTFCDEVREKLDYQTKRLRSHSCMALICSSNEVHVEEDEPIRHLMFADYENYYRK